jgi:hypothetical protein
MLQLLTAVILFFVAQQTSPYPQLSPLTDDHRAEWQKAYRQWKPGPKVEAEIKRLNQRESELATSHARGHLPIEALTIELQRLEIQRHLTWCIALVASPRDEFSQLIVVRANRQEIMKVFPLGKLPAETLQPNQIYPTEPGSKRLVRYLTTYRWGRDGERFAVFAREPDQ